MASAKPLSLQEVILRLHEFWAGQGCVIWQPYNIQLGAGTNNPATLLHVLGPEPWRVAYVEPSVRPDDGRYAENPNRMQMYYQYQVILKPDPGNPQEIYLKSLKALGIDSRQHDIRFVEDNWESPALGAWGLGWEVWLDGQEITQYTYFQQAGGLAADPVSVEITYGIERIVLALQGVDSAWEIDVTKGITYADIFRQSEIEHCRYYFEIADPVGLRAVYDTYETEHRRALEAGALLPAYDYVLKCSHLFNVMDTRGAIGVTERAAFFRRMRDMSRNVAKVYLEQRESLGFPLLEKMKSAWQKPDHESRTFTSLPMPSQSPQDVLLEIGVEEMPTGDVTSALAQLQESVPALLADARLDYHGIEFFATPRRLVVHIRQVAPHQPSITREYKGPPVSRAFDAEGQPTQAASGFAGKYGVATADLMRKEADGGEYVFAYVEDEGQPATEVLSQRLMEVIDSIKFEKSMRWNASGIAFSRPIRWIMALYGENRLLPLRYAGIISDHITCGLRAYESPQRYIRNSEDYFQFMAEQGILLDPASRREKILNEATALAQEVDGHLAYTPDLLEEVTHLVEAPTTFRGSFDEKFLALPREVLVMVMRKHQRYFAVEDDRGNLLPYFIAVRNGDREHLEMVTHGNEQVLIARFSDAEFFYKSDIESPLESYLEKLKTLTFQEKLGSMFDKNNRVRDMVKNFADVLGAADDVVPIAERAAALAKADLGTQMVVEMTALQGVMGRIYAEKDGESPEVANAIFQHWLPRSADDALPNGAPGVLLALLDRLDSLVGLFAVGLAPTGSADPFALRRAALGIIQILIDQRLELDLREAVHLVATHQPVEVKPADEEAVIDFIVGRLRVWVEDFQYDYDVVEAVLAEQGHNPVRALAGIRELMHWTKQEDWELVLDSFARCVRIVRDKPVYELQPQKFTEEAERELFGAAFAASHRLHPLEHNIDRMLANFVTVVPMITRFFDSVMVMDEDQSVQENRLALLQYITSLAKGRADFSKLKGF